MLQHKILEMLDHRGFVYIFQGCHIKDAFPAWLGDFDDFDRHVVKDGHARNNRDPEPCAYKSRSSSRA